MYLYSYIPVHVVIPFVSQSQDVTVYKLKDEIDEAASRLLFLLDYAIFPCEWNYKIPRNIVFNA